MITIMNSDEEPTIELKTIIASSLKTALEKKQVLSKKGIFLKPHSGYDFELRIRLMDSKPELFYCKILVILCINFFRRK